MIITSFPHYAANIADYYADGKTNRYNREIINGIFRQHDDSDKWPINGRFNATERAIRKVRKFMRESGNDLAGLEYALTLDAEISRIVNNEN